MISTDKKIYFQHLDIIRFIAAFMIVILHAYEAYNGWYGGIKILTDNSGTLTSFGQLFQNFIFKLHIAVDIFFLISGFLITYILIEEKKNFNKINIKNFIIRRCFRIWPLYYFLIAITPLIITWLGEAKPDYIPNIFFYNNFNTIKTKEWTYPFAHFWSICIEEHFYLIWPFIIAFTPLQKLHYVFSIIISLSIIYRIYLTLVMPDPTLALFLNSFCRIDILVIGGFGALIYSQKKIVFQLPKLLKAILFIVLLCIFSFDLSNDLNPVIKAGFEKYIPISIITLLLLDFNFNPNKKHYLQPNSTIHYFGKISYGIYMYSNILLPIIIKKIMWVIPTSNGYVFLGLVIFLSIVIPIISYELFEKKFIAMSSRFKMMKTER